MYPSYFILRRAFQHYRYHLPCPSHAVPAERGLHQGPEARGAGPFKRISPQSIPAFLVSIFLFPAVTFATWHLISKSHKRITVWIDARMTLQVALRAVGSQNRRECPPASAQRVVTGSVLSHQCEEVRSCTPAASSLPNQLTYLVKSLLEEVLATYSKIRYLTSEEL